MNGRDSVTLEAGGAAWRVRFRGAGPDVDLPPFVGAFEVSPVEGGEGRTLRVTLGLDFLWSADAALNAGEAAEKAMRTIGVLCVEACLAGTIEPDAEGHLQVRDFIGDREPEYTSVERFIGSLYDPPGRIERMARRDVLRCLLEKADADPEARLQTREVLAWSGKRRFYDEETARDALAALERDGLVEQGGQGARIPPDRLNEARATLT